mgnify:CR=1 FL=1
MFLISENYDDRVALINGDGYSVTYKEFKDLVSSFSSYLDSRALIFIIGSNDIASLVCYFSSFEKNIVPLLLSKDILNNQLDDLISIYNPKYIFSQKKVAAIGYSQLTKYREYSLLSKSTDKYKLHNDLALLLTTSGSTGSRKLVKLTKKNLESNAKSISEYLEIDQDNRAITSLPFNYSYGLSVINSHLYSGGSIVLTNLSMMEKDFWSIIRKNSVTSLAGVPYNYEIISRLNIDKLDVPSLNKMTQAGGKLSNKIVQNIYTACKNKSIDFYTMYGQTEASPRISYLPTNDTARKPNSIGIAIPGGCLWIEDEKGSKITKDGLVGELIYQGDNVSMGYAEKIYDLSLENLNQGILRTGDLAFFDKDGYFYIKGRKNRFVKIFGIRISLDSLERMMSEKGYICAAIGDDFGLQLYVVSLLGLSTEELRAEVASIIGINMIVISIIIVADLPRLETGKINYKLLKK